MSVTLKRKRIIILASAILILSVLLFLPRLATLSDKLYVCCRTDANILLVEGWLNPREIVLAGDEFRDNGYEKIITTGVNFSTNDYYMMPENGNLIFYPPVIKDNGNKKTRYPVTVKAYSQLSGENCARFNVIINDTIIGTFTADRKKRDYVAEWEGNLETIDSIMVRFINDDINPSGDRNLYVKEVIVNNQIRIPYSSHTVYEINSPGGKKRYINNFSSYAQIAKNNLYAAGIDSTLITALPAGNVIANRTLASALTFRNWLDTTNTEIKGINIVSVGSHSRRTWMTYNKIIDNKYYIGIIALPDQQTDKSVIWKIFKTIREALGNIYYWLILLPY